MISIAFIITLPGGHRERTGSILVWRPGLKASDTLTMVGRSGFI
jgi:hypothetical protein